MQQVGQINMNGQMVDLFSFGDFVSGAGDFIGKAAEIGKEVHGQVKDMAPVVSGAW